MINDENNQEIIKSKDLKNKKDKIVNDSLKNSNI